jgi:hypothetical protein
MCAHRDCEFFRQTFLVRRIASPAKLLPFTRESPYSARVKRRLLLVSILVASVVWPGAAFAVAPFLGAVSHQDRHPSASFSAPRADFATIYLATKPDRATDGSFLQENIKELDLLTDSEIQSGRWSDENQIDPGTYWVMLPVQLRSLFTACVDGS